MVCIYRLSTLAEGGGGGVITWNLFVSLSTTIRKWYYRKRGSASYIVREVLSVREREREIQRERERERERDGSDVTIVARLAMNSHFHLPKIRTFRFSLHTSRLSFHGEVTIVALKFAMSFTLSLAKIRTFRFSLHTSRLSLHGEVTIVALKFAMSSHFPLPKFFRPLCSPSFKWHEPHDEWSKTQDKWSNPAQTYFVLPIEKPNQINTKNYWK